ncbi:MAG TPA: hypothetical protein VL996_13555 [Methylocella sp.]|nr:hypothetical protein [Methylocella sp.]
MTFSVRSYIGSIADSVKGFTRGVADTERDVIQRDDAQGIPTTLKDKDGVSNYFSSDKSGDKSPGKPRSPTKPSVFAKFRFSKGVALVIGVLVAAYVFATQFTGPPNYDATYDNVMPPKGPYGPVTIRKDRSDPGVSGYGSKIVAVAAAAIEDELSRGWCPAESFLTPSSLRTDTCAFQLGKYQVLADSIQAFKQQKIGFKGTSNDYAPDLIRAAGNINFSPDVWIWIYGTNRYFSDAVKNLRSYNTDLVNGKTGFNADLYRLDQLMEVFVEETEGEESSLAQLEVNNFILIGSSRAAFDHGKGVFAMVCELMKAFEVDGFKIISDRNAWDSFDIAKGESCKVSQIRTPVISIVGDISSYMQELKGAAQISHARLSQARNALAAPNHE